MAYFPSDAWIAARNTCGRDRDKLKGLSFNSQSFLLLIMITFDLLNSWWEQMTNGRHYNVSHRLLCGFYNLCSHSHSPLSKVAL